jgi:hypothetical protein
MEIDANSMLEEVKQEEEEKGYDQKSPQTQQIALLTEMVGQLARKHDEVNLSVVELSRVITDARKQENVADIRLRLELSLK